MTILFTIVKGVDVMDDRQIIALYNQRNESAIEKSADKYGNYCFSIAINILNNEQDSEECVNDTWLRAWNTIPPQQPNYLKLFLAKITRNLSFNKYKEMNCQKRGGGEMKIALDEIGEIVSGTSDVESTLIEKELIQSINFFLHSLPEKHCNIFIKRYFHFDSTSKIALTYNLTEGNVLKILSRTRLKLKNYL